MMVKVEKRILIKAPIRSIFCFIDDPINLARATSGMIEVSDVLHLRNGGRRFQCVIQMAGSHIQCFVDCTEHSAYRCLAYHISGGMHGSMRWLFRPQGDDTEVTLSIDYEVPHPLLKRHTESAVTRRNERGIQLLLCNLKSEAERQMHLQGEENRYGVITHP